MQKRKILFIGLLAIFAIVIIGSASAFDLGFLSGGSDDSAPQEVTIEGIDFNIPEGFKEDVNNSIDDVKATAGTLTYTMNGKTFENDDGDVIVILIADYGEYNVTDDVLKQVSDEKKTIKDYNGYIKKDGKFYIYSYEVDGDLVTITTADESLIEQVLV